MEKVNKKEYIDLIISMLETAEKHNLVAEVVYSFGNARYNGLDIDEAIEEALLDWDIE